MSTILLLVGAMALAAAACVGLVAGGLFWLALWLLPAPVAFGLLCGLLAFPFLFNFILRRI